MEKHIVYRGFDKVCCTFYCSYNYIFNQEIDIETIRQEEKDYLRSKKLQEEKNNQEREEKS